MVAATNGSDIHLATNCNAILEGQRIPEAKYYIVIY
jgi:hypothetical protein